MVEKKIDCVKKDVRSVLITAKNGLSLEEFRKAYKTLLGVRFPSREFGYTLDIDFLNSIPDVVHIKIKSDGTYQLFGIADETTEHIQKLVSRQRPKITKNIRNHTNGFKLNPHICVSKDTYRCRPFVPAKLRCEIIELVKQFPGGMGYSSLMIAYQNFYKKRLNLEWLSSVPEEQFAKLANVLPELSLKVTGNQEKIFCLNHQSNDINHQMISESYCVKKHLKAVGKSLATSTSVQSEENNKHSDASTVPQIVKDRLEQVLKKYPNGILAVHFPMLYEEITKIPLDVHDFGFNNLLELAGALPNIFFHVKALGNSKDWILLHRDYSKNALQILGNFGHKTSSVLCSPYQINVPPSTHHSPISSSILHTSPSIAHIKGKSYGNKMTTQKMFPHYMTKNSLCDIAPSSLTYIQAKLPEDTVNKFMSVFVSAITNPSQFWFQLQTEEVVSNFNKLEEEIISFYGKEQLDGYKLADADILIGSSCIAYSSADNHWYRALITALPDIDHATVSFVDYGSRQRIHRSKLYHLKNKFITLPAYANEAQLAYVKPLNQVWDQKACKKFISLCNSVYLKAKIDSVYDGIASVFLCDISGSESIYINDVLVNEEFAEVDLTDFYHIPSDSGSTAKKNLESDILHYSNHVMEGQFVLEEVPEIDVKSPQTSYSSYLHLRNGTLKPKKLFNEFDSPDSLFKKRRYVKKVALGDGYKVNIIALNDKAYVSSGDLCNLFWMDKEPEVLDLMLKFQNDGFIPTTSILEKDFEDLFSQCKRYSVKGFNETEKGNSLVLYPLKHVMKVLNILGHPSSKIRETISKEVQIFDPHDRIWDEFQELNEENLEESSQENDSVCNRLCLYDLKAKLEGLCFKRFKLMKDLQENANDNSRYITEIEKLESMQNTIAKQMEEIKSICSMYASFPTS